MDPWWTKSVELVFWSSYDWTDKAVGEQLLHHINDLGFIPEKFGDEDPPSRRLRKGSSGREVLSLWSNQTDQLSIKGHNPHDFQVIVHLNPRKGVLPHSLHFLVSEDYFQKDGNVRNFLEFAERLYNLLRPLQGDAGHVADRNGKTVVVSSMKVGNRTAQVETHIPVPPTTGLSGIYWANFYGPQYVSFFSKARLDSVESYNKKCLEDGGCLILTSQNPLEYTLPETKRLEHALIDHLGSDAFFDKSQPDRVLSTPLWSKVSSATKSIVELKKLSSLLQCPKCGESSRIAKVTDDQVNNLAGFRCSKCGAVWAIEKSLIGLI